MKHGKFQTGRWDSLKGQHVDLSLSEWSNKFLDGNNGTYSQHSRKDDMVAIARMFVWTLKKMGVSYKSYDEMDADGVPPIIQQVWFDTKGTK